MKFLLGLKRNYLNHIKGSMILTTLLAFLICNLALLIFSSIIMINKSSENLIDLSNKNIGQIISKTSDNVEEVFEKVKIPLVLLSSNTDIIECMNSFNEMTDYEKLVHKRRINNVLINMNTSNPIISDILVIGKNGYFTNMTGKNGLKWDYNFNDQKWVRQLMNSKERKLILLGLHYQDFYYYKEKHNRYAIAVGIPVLNENNIIIGVVVCDLNINGFVELLENSSDQLGQTYIVDDKGTIIVHEDEARIGTRISSDYDKLFDNKSSGNFKTTISGEEYLVTYSTSEVTEWKIVSDISLDIINGYSSELEEYMKDTLLIAIIINIILSIIISYLIYQPLNKLIHKIRTTKESTMANSHIDFKFSELNAINHNFEVLIDEFQYLMKKNYQTKLDLKDAQFNALYNQINPHFLFNTLQILQTEIIYGHVEESNEIILALGELLRYSTYNSNPFVMIADELYYIECYCNIFQKKYDNKIQFRYEAPNELLNYYMPKLLLQPIVENSIKHGIYMNQTHPHMILITIRLINEQINIKIEDNGSGIESNLLKDIQNSLKEGKKSNDSKNSIGLVNINERLKLMFGKEYSIKIRSRKGQFTVIELVLPKLNSEVLVDNLQENERNLQ